MPCSIILNLFIPVHLACGWQEWLPYLSQTLQQVMAKLIYGSFFLIWGEWINANSGCIFSLSFSTQVLLCIYNWSCSAFSNITNFYSVTCCMYNQSYCGCELGVSLSWVVFDIYMYIKIRHKNITQTTPYYMSTPYTTPNKMNPITRKNMSKSGFCWQQHTMTNTWKTHCKDYRL